MNLLLHATKNHISSINTVELILLVISAVTSSSSSSGISKGALAGIVLGAIAGSVTLSAIVAILILKIRLKDYRTISRRRKCEYIIMRRRIGWGNVILSTVDQCLTMF